MGANSFDKGLMSLLISIAERFAYKQYFSDAAEIYCLLAEELSSHSISNSLIIESYRRAKILYGKAIEEKDSLGRDWLDDALTVHYREKINRINKHIQNFKFSSS